MKTKKTTSMYKGTKPFDREQLIFLVDAAMSAALDRIESGLPSAGMLPEERKSIMRLADATYLGTWDGAALETCGMFLGTLYAQITGDGLGIGDAIAFVPKGQKYSLLTLAEHYVKRSVKLKLKAWDGNKIHPDCRPLATAWVKEMFKDYLNT